MEEIIKMFGGTDNIWAVIRENAPKVGIEATRIMLELFYVLKSPKTGIINKSLIVAALGYQLLPEDVLPREKFGILGFLDNGITLAFAYNRVKSSVTPEIEQQVNNVLSSWFDADEKTSGQEWTPSNNQDGDYAPQSVFQHPHQQTINNPSMDGFYGNNNRPSQPKPIWNDDEDVVID